MKTKAWTLAVILGILSAVPVGAGVFYSPVFNMPLQPAPSPSHGGFYWVMPGCGLMGPNYYLLPPFNPVTGFDNAFVGQQIFWKQYEQALGGATSKGQGAHPPTKQVGVGGYAMDYSDPNCFKNFDAAAPMPNGYVPFAPIQQPPSQYGNSPLPMPRYANYPNYQAYAPAPNYGYFPSGMTSQPWYQGTGYNVAGYQGNPIVQAQAMQPYPAAAMPMRPAYPHMYNPGFANLPQVPAPYYPLPNYSMPQYPTPMGPNYAMPQTVFPPLPNPSYEPPPGHDANRCKYFHNPMARSPRDFFMWTEDQEEKAAARTRRPMYVP